MASERKYLDGTGVSHLWGKIKENFVDKDDSRLTDPRTPKSHSHGNIGNAGTISSTAVSPTNGDYLLISNTDNSGKIERGVAFSSTHSDQYLRKDGLWAKPVDTNTHYSSKNIVGASSTAYANAAATNGNVWLNHLENNSNNPTSSHNIVGSGIVTVTSDANGKITIYARDTNTDTHHQAKNVFGGSASTTSDSTSALNNGGVFLNLVENGAVRSYHKVTGASGIKVTYAAKVAATSGSSEVPPTLTVAHTNSITAGTISGSNGAIGWSGSFNIPKITYDAQGHITSCTTTSVTLPADPRTGKNVVTNSSTGTSDTTTALTNGNVWLNHIENGEAKSNHNIKGAGGTTVTTDASANIIITSGTVSHSHGNLAYGGNMTDTAAAVVTGDALTVRKSGGSSPSNKLATATIAFDTSATTKYLCQDGVWSSITSMSTTDIDTAIANA